MIRRSLLQWLAVTTTALASASAAYGALSDPRDARVAFQAIGPAGMKIDGVTTELSVVEKDGNVVVDVPLGNVTTGIALRDRHMKEKYLDVAKYPSATLVVARSALKTPGVGAKISADVPGALTLHGQSKPVTIHYAATGDSSGFAVEGAFHIRMDEFGIAAPTYLGVSVKPDVDVTARFHVGGN
jgi:polyisoprenoid-binding protein YceI